jgi:hypothetical protein
MDATRDGLDRRRRDVRNGVACPRAFVAVVLLSQGVRRWRRRSWLQATEHGRFGRWRRRTVRHGAAGGQRRWPRHSSATEGLLGSDRGLVGGRADLDLLSPSTTFGRRTPLVVEGGSTLRPTMWLDVY